MKSNIEERLRGYHTTSRLRNIHPAICDEAADEIEALKDALMDWRNSWLCPVGHFDADRLLRRTDYVLGISPIAGEYE